MKNKQAKIWLKIRAEWKKQNPPNFQGYYICYLCGTWIPENELTLDHVIPKSNAKNYANRHDFNNLKPCCYPCNSKKGSKKS